MDGASIILNSGRKIILEELSQHHTYAGLIEGSPTVEMNRKIIERCLKYAKEKLWIDVEPILIPPIERHIEINGGSQELYDEDRKEIQTIVCLSCWNCYKPARNEFMMGSVLKIVWFQDKFAMPIDSSIVDQLKEVNWTKYAKDYDI